VVHEKKDDQGYRHRSPFHGHTAKKTAERIDLSFRPGKSVCEPWIQKAPEKAECYTEHEWKGELLRARSLPLGYNAVTESFFHTLRTKLVYFEIYRTRLEERQSIFEYMEIFYNRLKIHSYLGYVSSVDFGRLSIAA